MKKIVSVIAGLFFAVAVSIPASAADLPRTHLKVHGLWSMLSADKEVFRPFWTEHVTSDTGGQLTTDYTTFDQLGLKGGEILRLLKMGVFDFGSGNISMMSSDFPEFNGTELWGVLQDMDTVKKATEVYGPVLDKIFQENYGSKLLYFWPNPPSVLFCKDPVSSIDDLKGRKIRAYSPPLSDFIEGVGGIPVSISFGEVTTALQRGTLDCGVTGSLSANTSKWFDVVDYLYNLPGGISTWFSAVNLKAWDRMDPAVKAYLSEQFVQLEKDLWANGIMQMEQGISCNSGVGECTLGIPGGMTIIESIAADRARLAEISENLVVRRWAARCGDACVKTWNETIGALVGMTAVPAE